MQVEILDCILIGKSLGLQ